MKFYLSSILVIALSIGFVPAQASADDNYGTFMVSKGDITVTRADGKTEKGRIGLKVYSKDAITAGKDARAKVVFVDKNVMNISPESKVIIESYKADANGNDRSAELNVAYGKIRNTVNQKYDGEKSKFTVKTPSAVAGVRGTDFMVSFSSLTQASKVVTFAGAVDVAKFDKTGALSEAVRVVPGQFTVTSPSAEKPSQPQSLPKQELANMNVETGGGPAEKGGPDNGNNGRDPANANESPKDGPKDSPGDKNKGAGNDNRQPSMLDSVEAGPGGSGMPAGPPPVLMGPTMPDFNKGPLMPIGSDFINNMPKRTNLRVNITY